MDAIRAVLVLALALAPGDDPAWKVYEAWPFDAAEAARRQAETAKVITSPEAPKIILEDDPGATLTFRLIPAGKFERWAVRPRSRATKATRPSIPRRSPSRST